MKKSISMLLACLMLLSLCACGGQNNTQQTQPVQDAVLEVGFGRENIPAMMAAVVVITVPLVALFLVFRKKIMAGVARGGTKG